MRSASAATYVAVARSRGRSPLARSTIRASVSTIRRRIAVTQPSPRIGTPSRTGRLKSTLIRAVRPQLSVAASDQAMTSSRIVQMIPPWAIPSQPWKRSAGVSSVQQRSPSTWRSRWIPCSFSAAAGEAAVRSDLDCQPLSGPSRPGWSRMSARPRGVRPTGPTTVSPRARPTSDVKVPDLARLGIDEVLARSRPSRP